MFKKSSKMVAIFAAMILSLSACGNSADEEELESLREENESLKAQVETTVSETTSVTTTSLTDETTTQITESEYIEPEYIDHKYGNKVFPSEKEVIYRIIVDKNSSEKDLLDLFEGAINDINKENMTVWFYSDESMTGGEYDVAIITRKGTYGKPNIIMVDNQTGDSLRKAAENNEVSVTEAPPKWAYYDDCAVSIEGATIVSDYKGNDSIAVEIKFRNDSDKDRSYAFTFVTKAFQNGIECESATLDRSYSEQFDTGTSVIDIKPGTEFTVYEAFKLRDDSDVVVEVSGLFDIDSEVIARTTFS